jgi:prepilin-type N-terminal cleavage/methylation domain-containing protein
MKFSTEDEVNKMLSRGERGEGKKGFKGLTLVEVLVAMLVVGIVLGLTTIFLQQNGVVLMPSDTSYSAAQREALSSVEMMSKEIVSAGEVEIIADAAHDIPAGLAEGWNYIVLDSKSVHHLYGGKDETIAGSEYIEAISFDTEVFSDDLSGGGRLLRIYVKASGADANAVDLDFSMAVYAALGVKGKGAAVPSTAGHILRYRLQNGGSFNYNDPGTSSAFGALRNRAAFLNSVINYEIQH